MSYPHSYTVDLLTDVAEFLDGQASADGTPDGYRPNRAMQLLQDVEQALERIKVYQHKNPLGGPAKVFEAMAACIRAGDDYHRVLAEYGFALKQSIWPNGEPSDIALSAIDSEPEVPGDMPDEMWKAIRNDRDAVQNAIRIAVQLTKKGIRERYLAAYDVTNGEGWTCPKCGGSNGPNVPHCVLCP